MTGVFVQVPELILEALLFVLLEDGLLARGAQRVHGGCERLELVLQLVHIVQNCPSRVVLDGLRLVFIGPPLGRSRGERKKGK